MECCEFAENHNKDILGFGGFLARISSAGQSWKRPRNPQDWNVIGGSRQRGKWEIPLCKKNFIHEIFENLLLIYWCFFVILLHCRKIKSYWICIVTRGIIYLVNLSKSVRVFQGLAGLLRGISQEQSPREVPGFRQHCIHIPCLVKKIICGACCTSPSSCEDEYLYGLYKNPSDNTE